MTANCFVEFSGSDFQASCDQTKLIFERGQNSEMSEYHLRSLLKQEGTDLSGDIQFGHVGDESLSNAGVPKTVHLIISGQNDPRSGLETYLIFLPEFPRNFTLLVKPEDGRLPLVALFYRLFCNRRVVFTIFA